MDFACLKITSRVGACGGKTHRLIIAAVLGGVYSIAALFIERRLIYYILSAIVCIAVIYIAFYRLKDKFSRMIKIAFIYFGVSMLSGGGVSAAFYFFEYLFSGFTEMSPAEKTHGLSPSISLALSAGCFAAYIAVVGIKKANIDKIAFLRIEAFGKEIELSVLPDSGNMLREPFGGKLCTVISKEDLISLAGKEKAERIAYGRYTSADEERICIIPARTLNGTSVFYGFFPDEAMFLDASGKIIKNADTVIAVSVEESFEGGHAIVPQALI